MKSRTLLCSCALVLASPLASAMDLDMRIDPHWYIGIGYEPITLSTDDGGDFDVATASVKAGVALNPFLAVEGRYGSSVGDETRDVLGVQVTGKLDNYYGAYLKGMVPVHEMVSLYALAGYTHVDASVTTPLGSADDSDDGVSYGAGVALHVNRNFSVNAEWMSWLDKDDYDLTGYGVGLNYAF